MTSNPDPETQPRQQDAPCSQTEPYVLEDQVGFLLRLAMQRHFTLFNQEMVGELTPGQYACLVKLAESGPYSQNQLGRLVALDTATIKGVVGRLRTAGLVETTLDPNDRRRVIVNLSAHGREIIPQAIERGRVITEKTLAPLSERERTRFLKLLHKLT